MLEGNRLYMGLDENGERVYLPLSMCSRHGLIAGATGTGKTITMKIMAEDFSEAGVPVFLCDVKGDVSGICQKGDQSDNMEERIDRFGIRDEFEYKPFFATFWDLYGQGGHPIRATVSDMGPELLSRILGLTEVQEGVLNIIFKIADDNNLLLIDLKDLKSMINYVGEHKDEYTLEYGNIATQSLGAITRALIPIENQGGDVFFGEPMMDIMDWIRVDANGKGMINILDATSLIHTPKVYAIFLLWMIAELYEVLPEVGDLEKPRMVFFFDEAHLLFNDAPKVLIEKIEQMVKLIRSKGVGVFFVTQNPGDIPNGVLAQLNNKVQHALRAYTPSELKAVKAAVNSFRENPAFDSEEVIKELGTGEALVSFLGEDGIPSIAHRTKIICPQSKMAQCDPAIKAAMRAQDGMSKYDLAVDRQSAYEDISAQLIQEEQERLQQEALVAQIKEDEKRQKELAKQAEKEAKERERAKNSVIGSALGTVGREVGKTVGGKFGSFGKKVGGNAGASLARNLFKMLKK